MFFLLTKLAPDPPVNNIFFLKASLNRFHMDLISMTTFNYTMTVNVQMNVDPRSQCELFLGCRVEYSYKTVDVGQILNR